MRTYTIEKITGTPDWSKIPVMPIDNLLWTEPVPISAQAQICWDDENFYLRQEAVEPNIRAVECGPLADVFEDSCLEFFVQPTERPQYLNFEINPAGAIWLGHGVEVDTRIRLVVPEVEEVLNIQTERTPTGWVLTYRIPFSLIRSLFPDFEPKEGLQFRGNAFKCGDETVQPHYLAWNRVEGEEPAFHQPQYFGRLILGGL